MKYIFWTLYDFLYAAVLICSMPFFGTRFFGRDKKYHDFLERFAVYDNIPSKKNIWIHTVSIGELLAAFPFIEQISIRFKDIPITLSCVSRSARAIAEEKLPTNIIKIFLPFDFSFVVERSIKRLKPCIFVSIETEIWPNLFRILKKHHTPIIILNGRISEKSFRIYSKFKILLRRILCHVDCFIMKSGKDAENIIKLGADKKRVFIAGSMKFDYAYLLSLNYVCRHPHKTIVFGSIHPGEEEPIAGIIEHIINKYKDVNVVIVPRSLDKTNIYQILRKRNISFERFSQNKKQSRVLIVDKYGVLTDCYKNCAFAFVGGSLVPAGGQNPIEPLAFRKPVIYGNFHEDFDLEWKKICDAGAGFEVKNFKELSEKIEFLLNNPEIATNMGEAGYRVIMETKGGINQTIQIFEKYLYPASH